MDVLVPDIPSDYDGYRHEVRAFIAAHKPALQWKQRAGLRTPERREDVDALRAWTRALYDAGYVIGRFAPEVDPFKARILEEELRLTGIPYVMGNPLVDTAIRRFGTEDQQRTYLPAIARGDHIWTQLFSEPDAGSDLASLQCRARLEGDQYVVSGQKVWSTWAQWADYGFLLARSKATGERHQGISAFILDMRSEGVQVRPLREMTGTTDFNEVFLDGVRVPVQNVIGTPGEGWRVATFSLANERGLVGAGGEDRIAGLVRAARDHRRAGRPAIEDGAVRQDIGRLAALSRIQHYLSHRVATRAAHGTPAPWDAPLWKIWFSEVNLATAELGLSLQGPRSVVVEGEATAFEDGRWQDLFLYARAWTIAGGTNEILRNMIAERGLGLPREP
jgi:alkylation response protein AidB-like acyl-CoA dehydrogenase